MPRTTHHAAPMVLFAILSSLVPVSARAQTERTVPPNPFPGSPSRAAAPERTSAPERSAAPERTTASGSTAAERASTEAAPPPSTEAAPPPSSEAPSSESSASSDESELVRVTSTSVEVTPSEQPIEELAARAADAVPPPPPPDAALGALDDVLAGDRDPIAGVEAAPIAQPTGLPTRAETAAAIAEVTPSVRACARAQRGEIVELRIVFTANGNVTTATVGSAHLTPAQRSCVARAARRAHVAAFARPRFEVTYPVRL